jgi:redox-sensing transcriptional repressor
MYLKSSLRRLLLYRFCLVRFRQAGQRRIYGYELAREAGVQPGQLRKDLSNQHITGRKKGGYSVDELIDHLNIIFKRNEIQHVIIVGMGSLGKAVAAYFNGFSQRKQYVLAGFDINPVESDFPVFPAGKMEKYIRDFKIKIAFITVPADAAQETCNRLARSGVKAIMNFAPVTLKVPPGVTVNIH